jgi:hypothetical protein
VSLSPTSKRRSGIREGQKFNKTVEQRFSPGQAVVIREVWNGKVWGAQPVIVVRDQPDLMAFYATFDTIAKMPCTPDGGRVRASDRVASRWVLQDRGWNNLDLLRLNIPGSIYSVIIF